MQISTYYIISPHLHIFQHKPSENKKKISLRIRIKRKCQLLNITIKLSQLITDISVFQSGSWEAILLFLVFPCPNTPWIKWVSHYLTSAEFDDGLIVWIRCVEAWKHLQRARQGGPPRTGAEIHQCKWSTGEIPFLWMWYLTSAFGGFLQTWRKSPLGV